MTTAAATTLLIPFDSYLTMESPEHGRLTAAVVRALPQTEECRVYSSDTLLYIEKAERSTYADASIVCGATLTRGAKDKNGRSLGEAITNPSVVVEALSRSTEQQDRNERFVLFQKLDSLEEYVLISQDERRIEVRRRVERAWISDIKTAGDSICIHGLDIAVDIIYN
jgi:Uma2 family endonuclease